VRPGPTLSAGQTTLKQEMSFSHKCNWMASAKR